MRFFLFLFIASVIAFGSTHSAAQPSKPSEKLLTDEELLTEADPAVPETDVATAAWIRENSRPLRSLTSNNYQDLEFLKQLLKGKRIVQLGESGHGVAEFNLAKVRLAKFLHQELGFDVIAFESPFYECYRADQQSESQQPSSALRNCLFAVWHTREVLPLFDYIYETKKGKRPLSLAGFDIQQRGSGEHGRAEFLRDAVSKIDPTYASEVYTLDKEFQTRSAESSENFNLYLQTEGARLIAAYDKLTNFLKRSEIKLKGGPATELKTLIIARQTAWSLSQLLRHRTARNRANSEIRDEGMAANLDFLLNELYPGRKIIVWGHNSHVRHKNEANPAHPIRRMGSWLVKRRRKELYTIGFYVYRGRMANNSRTIYEIKRGSAGSLESILYEARKKYLFVNVANQKRTAGTDWMFTAIPTFDWGKNEELLIPREQYDGLVFIDTANPPKYGLPR